MGHTKLVELGHLGAANKIRHGAEGGQPWNQKVSSTLVPDLLHNGHHIGHHLVGISIGVEVIVVQANEHHEEGPVPSHHRGASKVSIDLVDSS